MASTTASVQLSDSNSSGYEKGSTAGPGSARARYEEGKRFRDPVTLRAEQAARLTIPALFPLEGDSEDTQYPSPWSSVGAEGVQTLGAKLLLALFPVGIPMARRVPSLKVIEELRAKLGGEGQEYNDARTALNKALALQEQEMMDTLEEAGFRAPMAGGLEQGLVAGNFLVQMLDDFTVVVHTLRNYVVFRDLSGNITEILLHQCVDPKTLSPVLKAAYDASTKPDTQYGKPGQEAELFTWAKRIGEDKMQVCQYLNDIIVPGTEGTYSLDECPLFAVAINRIPGQTYGRGHCERYLGDLMSHDGLSESIVSGAAAIARFVTMVKPGGLTSKADIERAKNGAVINGREEDVKTLQSDKTMDLQVAAGLVGTIEKRLQKAFMDTSSIMRDAERVTAEEIRTLAQAIDTNFGGMYSVYVKELQRPLAVRTFAQMEKKRMLPKLPDDSVKVQIVGGLAALGRTSDYEKLLRLLTDMGKAIGPEQVAPYLVVGEALQRGATSIGVDSNGLFRDEKAVQEQKQQAQQAELNKAAAPNLVKGAADMHAINAQANAAPQA